MVYKRNNSVSQHLPLHLFLLFLFVFGAVMPSRAEPINLSCNSAPDSYDYGPSFDIKFENEIALIREVELCFRDCKRGKKPAKVYPITEKSEYYFEFQYLKAGTAPRDSNHWTFSFDDMKVSYGFYQVPWLGSLESWKEAGFVGKPSKEWVKLGDMTWQCKKRRTKIIN